MKILDFRTRPRTEYFFKDIAPKPIPAFEWYFSVYHMDDRLTMAPLEDTVEEMRAAGITQGVIFSGNFGGIEHVYEACRKYPDVFIGMTSIDVNEGVTKSMLDLEKAFNEYNIHGMTLSPFISGIYPTDPRHYPLYALCERMGKCVQIHSSTHFNPHQRLDLGDPNNIDHIAVDFPGLKLVLGHAGMGFGMLGITVAHRHRNVYIDFSGLRPRYLTTEMVYAANTILKKKAIFGTNYPTLGYDIAEEWKEVIREKNQPDFFYNNAARVLGILE
jgi:uncharacterized protein